MRTQKRYNPANNLDEQERLDWLRLIRTDNIGPITFYQLLERFGSAREALEALPELSRHGGLKKPLSPPSQSQVMAEYKALTKRGGSFITAKDNSYPLALSAIDDAPPVLSVLGNPAMLNRPCIAIVGARNASLNGRKFAGKLAADLGSRGQIVVSGMARGIDTAAHQGALASGTITVVAGGVNVVYPEENQKLYDEIIEKGAVIAESAFSSKPFAAAFPRRNRIVSGLSAAVVVVEAGKRSGSLITARMAGEQGRDIMAVPGSPVDPRAQGPNHLIREGATLVRNADDVLEILMDFSGKGFREPVVPAPNFIHEIVENDALTGGNTREILQEKILSNLSFTPINVDELIRACHVTVSELQLIIMELELAGRVKRLPGNKIILVEQDDKQ
ncbi:MAG: DNA-processing protein DprA [Alphaproteobacteria bacterium]|nr:DNA-processing protein DprA [Alphaproteobacteria bacterium]